ACWLRQTQVRQASTPECRQANRLNAFASCLPRRRKSMTEMNASVHKGLKPAPHPRPKCSETLPAAHADYRQSRRQSPRPRDLFVADFLSIDMILKSAFPAM